MSDPDPPPPGIKDTNNPSGAAPLSPPPQQERPSPVDLLILGSGWTTTEFLLPLLRQPTYSHITHAATTTRSDSDGPASAIPFQFKFASSNFASSTASTSGSPSPLSPSPAHYKALPRAKVIVVTFALRGRGAAHALVSGYRSVHGSENDWVQLGSTRIFRAPATGASAGGAAAAGGGGGWVDHESAYDAEDDRAAAEDELRALCGGVVLCLAGLWAERTRDPRGWLVRVAKGKDAVMAKGALHLVHGLDVARAVLRVCELLLGRGVDAGAGEGAGATATSGDKGAAAARLRGKRWIVTDLRVYDWWELMLAWGEAARARERARGNDELAASLRYETWVLELMAEQDVRALPRPVDRLGGRLLDSRAFWREIALWPSTALVTN